MAELGDAHFLVHSANKDKKYQGEKIVGWHITIERADGRDASGICKLAQADDDNEFLLF